MSFLAIAWLAPFRLWQRAVATSAYETGVDSPTLLGLSARCRAGCSGCLHQTTTRAGTVATDRRLSSFATPLSHPARKMELPATAKQVELPVKQLPEKEEQQRGWKAPHPLPPLVQEGEEESQKAVDMRLKGFS